MKKWLAMGYKVMILTGAITLFMAASVAAADSTYPRIRINGEFINIADQQPVIVGGRTLVPLRGVMEQLGFDVDWCSNTQTATLHRNGQTPDEIRVTIGSPTMSVCAEGSPEIRNVGLDVPAQIMNNRTMVPLRAISEATGFQVDWDGVNRIADIRTDVEVPADSGSLNDEAQHTGMLDINEFERGVFELINYERTSRGLHELIWNDVLAAASRYHSMDMAENNFFGHVGSDGLAPLERAQRFGFIGLVVYENCVGGKNAPQEALQTWMDSQQHRNNILSRNMTYIGIGFVRLEGSQWITYVTVKIA